MRFLERLDGVQASVAVAVTAAMAHLADVPVVHAMRYAAAGGKRLRAFLVLEGARLHGLTDSQAMPAAVAVEALHAYSLVHDDLPAMDNDDLRRGQPTVHRKWNEATAILAGDALQTLAFRQCCDPVLGSNRIALAVALADAAGAEGMVLGQALDIAAEGTVEPLRLAGITALQAAKTGALFRFAAEAGPILAGADRAPMRAYADALGLAFQIADDLIDVEGDPAKAGKALRKDAVAGKATFVTLLGVDGAKARARALIDEAEAAVAQYGDAAGALRDCARFVIVRES